MDMAQRMINSEETKNPNQRRLTELQKGRISINYIKMNSSPHKYKYYKRFIDNDGSVVVPGYNSKTGKVEDYRLKLLRELRAKENDRNLMRAKSKGSIEQLPVLNVPTEEDEVDQKKKRLLQ